MTVFEERFRDLVDLMPKLKDADEIEYLIRYDWGTQEVLNKWLLLQESISKYPLIWLVTGKSAASNIESLITRKARFVIATRSNNKNEFNEFQYDTDFTNVLNPVLNDFLTLLNRSGITRIIGEYYDYELKPNYSVNNDGKGLIDTWNAIVLDIEIEVQTDRCINIIRF